MTREIQGRKSQLPKYKKGGEDVASRRMFSLRIIDSGRFLKMPISSQALYFHLGMHADDDGVVEAYSVMKSIGCTEDDLKVLIGKKYVQVLNDDLVTYIVDWRENNTIRPDRKVDSIYKDLLLEKNGDIKLVEKKERKDTKKVIDIPKEKKSTKFIPPTIEEIMNYCKERGNNINPHGFFDFYESKGWMVGKNKMKDWKAAVRNWERTERKSSESNTNNKPKNSFQNFPQREHTQKEMDDLERMLRV